ncbi:lysoplasmalogenase [Paenibacillus sp. FJAT-26967]|uniref:lysoplasmalogenase n=1 Tax=Paenibacillus sp. FJAT-26967 TaxID=1729690 RepID=UPI000837AA8E|nr:lysoplasmalogenase [Paenibacillus sp. FJAT-26967]
MVMGWLWAVQVVLFIAGTASGIRRNNKEGSGLSLPLWARMCISLTLTAAAFALWRGNQDSPYAEWVFWGMAWSFIGDLTMAGLIPMRHRLIGGMATFAVAHGFYIAAFTAALNNEGVSVLNTGLILAGVIYLVLLIAGWLRYIRNLQAPYGYNAGAFVYGLWISIMASVAVALAWGLGAAHWVTALGGLLFVISDFIIAVVTIGAKPFRHNAYWVWLTYVGAQMCIVYASVLAL